MGWITGFILALALLVGQRAAAEDWHAPFVDGGQGRVVAVTDGDTVSLADGRIVRLVGIQAPKLPLDRPDFVAWPLADAAQAALQNLALGRSVQLYFGQTRQDRHGRLLAHLARGDDVQWLQAAMLRQGMARVYSFADNRAGIAALLDAEAQARKSRRGIWRDPFYAVRTPAALEAAPEEYAGSFQIVRGRVKDTGESRGKLYVNFGGRWKTDFTLEVLPAVRSRFADDPRFSPARLAGALIEVRGWIGLRNGPMIEMTHPEQIVLLDAAPTGDTDRPADQRLEEGAILP